MRTNVRTYCVALALVLGMGALAVGKDFHVAPVGADANPGTMKEPFRSLGHARDAARQEIAHGLQEDITVRLHGGVYELAEPLAFGPADSGDAPQAITYAAAKGEKVVVSGGSGIKGWEHPLFPALRPSPPPLPKIRRSGRLRLAGRSGPTAVSGDSGQKQIPRESGHIP